LEDDAHHLAPTVAPALRVVQGAGLPPLTRAHEHPGCLGCDTRVHRWNGFERLLVGDEAEGAAVLRSLAEAAVHALDLQLSAERGHPVAESPIDRLLGGPEARDRLAALVRVVELDAHELGENPAACVRRQDAD